MEVKVIEVTESTVKYKKYTNLDGPVYSINKRELAVIIYANGESEVFDQTATNTPEGNKAKQEATEKKQTTTLSEENEQIEIDKGKRFILAYEAGYSLFSDQSNNASGMYLGMMAGYKFNRALSTEILFSGGTFFPKEPTGSIGITELKSLELGLRGTYRIHFSPIKDNGLYLVGGLGYAGTYGKYTDYLQKGSPTYNLDGYDGFGYRIGGGLKFGIFGVGLEYQAVERIYSFLKIGVTYGF